MQILLLSRLSKKKLLGVIFSFMFFELSNTFKNNNGQKKLETTLSGNGLRFRFQRDLAQKYRKYFSGGNTNPQPALEQSLHNASEWKVLGYFDFLSITRFGTLEALDDDSGFGTLSSRVAGESLECLRSSLDLALLPCPKKEGPDKDFFESLIKPGGENPQSDPSKDPLLAIIKIILSPSIFDFEGSFNRIPNAIQYLIEKVDEAFKRRKPDLKREYFTTLSGPDLIIVALPKTPRELLLLEELVHEIKNTQLSELEKNCREPEQKNDKTETWEGHACTAVHAMLAFREESESYFADEEGSFFLEEENIDYRFHFRLRLDCGHESNVIGDIWKVFRNSRWNRNEAEKTPEEKQEEAEERKKFFEEIRLHSSWGHYSLEGSFRHLGQIIKLWKKHWFNGQGNEEDQWREKHLIDSSAKISFSLPIKKKADGEPENGGCHGKQVWQLHDNVRNTLDTIQGQLKDFSKRFLNKRYASELMNVYFNFRRCFFRHDLIGVARDLVPFFKQLGELFSYVDLWEEYLEGDGQDAAVHYNVFLKDIENLFIHLGRAIQNRIEHRSMQSDPPMPHTIAHGACRVLIAHSAAFWLAAELFSRQEGSNAKQNPPGIASDFSGCVCAGVRGQVMCSEILGGFRQFLKEKAAGNATGEPLANLARKHLVALDISGRSLLQPASLFVHCLHEMAELSDWITRDNCPELRKILNQHVMLDFSEIFQKEILEAAFEQNPAWREDEAIISEVLNVAYRYFSYCVASMEGADLKSDRDVVNTACELCSKAVTPVDFVREYLLNALREKTDKALWETKRKIEEVFGYAASDAVFLLIPSVVSGSSFKRRVDALWEFNAELMADCGMWTAFDHIFSPEFSGRSPNRQPDKIKDLNRIFCGLIAMTQTFYSKKQTEGDTLSRLDISLLYRWAVQSSALCGDGEAWTESIISAIEKYQKSHEGSLTNFKRRQVENCFRNMIEEHPLLVDEREKYYLTKKLRQLKAYGGKVGNPRFIAKTEFNDMEHELFEAFRKAWSSSDSMEENGSYEDNQIDFATKLWITASRFGFKQILEQVQNANT